MTYQALIQSLGGRFHLPYDGNSNYDTFGWSQFASASLSQTTNNVYVNDAPAGLGSTQSIRIGGNAQIYNTSTVNIPRWRINHTFAGRREWSFTVWIKSGQITKGSSVPSAILLTNKCYGLTTTYDESYNLFGGTWNDYGIEAVNNLSVSNRVNVGGNATVVSNSASAFEFPNDDQWHNVTFVARSAGINGSQATMFEASWFVDGILISYQYGDGFFPGWGAQSGGYIETPSSNYSQASPSTPYRQYSNFTLFDKALTLSDIRQIAWYNKTPQEYNQTVLADNPLYFAPLNNVDNSVDTEVYGTAAATWGPLNDTGITAGVEGVLGRAWYVPAGSGTNPAAVTTTPSMMSDLNNVIAGTGNYSIEFWVKVESRPTSGSEEIFGTKNANNSARLQFAINSSGNINGTFPNRTGTSTYSVLTTSAPDADQPLTADLTDSYTTANYTLFDLLPFDKTNRFADNQWHHVVLSVHKDKFYNSSTQSIRYYYQMFVDGLPHNPSYAINTSGQIFPEGPQDSLTIGFMNLISGGNSNFTIDKIAFYDYDLKEEQIIDHLIAGKYLIASNTGAVKYWNGTDWQTSTAQKVWNGTDWIDWDHKYWNGTAWIDL